MLHKHTLPDVVCATGGGSNTAPPAAERYSPIAFLLMPIDLLAGRRLALRSLLAQNKRRAEGPRPSNSTSQRPTRSGTGGPKLSHPPQHWEAAHRQRIRARLRHDAKGPFHAAGVIGVRRGIVHTAGAEVLTGVLISLRYCFRECLAGGD